MERRGGGQQLVRLSPKLARVRVCTIRRRDGRRDERRERTSERTNERTSLTEVGGTESTQVLPPVFVCVRVYVCVYVR